MRLLCLFWAQDTAHAHGSNPIESDLNNDRKIVWCNNAKKGGLNQTMVKEAFQRWNSSLTNAGLTSLVKFVPKSQTNLPCELTFRMALEATWGAAWIDYWSQDPDLIYYYMGEWNKNTVDERRFVLMHEIGHSLGFDHAPTPEYCYPQYGSVLTSWCAYHGAPVPYKPGPHDMDDVRFYWGPNGVLPQTYSWEE